ncbi:TonB-dependent receptor plug domain-containing protein [Dyadobacter chenhuakuii]|uniref:TonB-dependent receptor plug domain-containing protein n=1 Tax=Dyadobacter chenhuakuii TaxID=2909339 RepID=A0ABY4XH46_9BACT|nr:TonB-dependent receptor [Dyadobacter chenhuakuii]MCF2495528.1 TonB-dependent receptor plug domain-containing protein [Dyadobacter chenhuakuii]USJ29565.1 TonB-dependent receptor plug domain-containing protein [Dyadobacter chenhuakuii]
MALTIATWLFRPEMLVAQSDSIRLEPIIVKGFVPEKFMSGLKIQKFDSASLNLFRFQNISELLSLYTPIAFKNYGPGQLNTASFRGTSANHTAVLWNGLNINSPILGQTDYSTIPVTGFDQLSVQYGSAASIVGSDAVGGSILLGSAPSTQPLQLSIGRQQESFNNHQTQVTARYAAVISDQWSFSGKTNVYDGRMNNDFPYTERNQYTVLPSTSFQRGLVQDLFFNSKNDHQISAHVWLTRNRLTLTPEDKAGRELTLTEAYRTMLRYQFKDFTIRTSWVRDIIDYAKGDYSQLDHAVTDKFSNRVERDFQFNAIQIKAGGEWAHYRAQVAGYDKALVTENRGDIFLLTRWQATARLVISANLRQAFVTKFDPPFTPSLGADYFIVQKETHNLKLKGSIGRSYRVPTLNERFWKELGNPDIRPENGWNKEVSLEQNIVIDANQTFSASLTAYHNRIKDWTYWNPTQSYRVENLQQVLARGIEAQAGWRHQINDWKSGINLGYALNKSAQEKAYDAYSSDIIGKQLVFVPMHSGNLNAFIQYKNTRLTGQAQTISKRFSTFDNTQFLEGYTLTNLLAEHTFVWDKIKMRLQGQINNLANTFYLNVRNNAMPGRSFALSLILIYDPPHSAK